MKTSTILMTALVLIIVFVGGMSASGLVDEQPAVQSDAAVEVSFDLDQMLESSKAQISEQSNLKRDVRGIVVNDFERLM